MADEDRAYCRWLRLQPCAGCEAPPGIQFIQVHHSTVGTTSPLFPEAGIALGSNSRDREELTLTRGKGQRAHDHWGIPMCWECHRNLHDFRGPLFGTMNSEQRREWQDAQVRILRSRFLDMETF